MIENELKRIADALEAIAIALQPVNVTGTPMAVAAPQADTPKSPKKPKAEKPAPVATPAPESDDPLSDGNEGAASPGEEKVWTTDEIVAAVQKAVKVNRDATLAVCRKYGYQKSLKDILEAKYSELAKELETVK